MHVRREVEHRAFAECATESGRTTTAGCDREYVAFFGELPRKSCDFANVICGARINHHFGFDRQYAIVKRICLTDIVTRRDLTSDVPPQIGCYLTHVPLRVS